MGEEDSRSKNVAEREELERFALGKGKKKKKKAFDSIMEKGVVRIRDMADSRF